MADLNINLYHRIIIWTTYSSVQLIIYRRKLFVLGSFVLNVLDVNCVSLSMIISFILIRKIGRKKLGKLRQKLKKNLCISRIILALMSRV